MPTCPNCKKAQHEGQRFCPECGRSLEIPPDHGDAPLITRDAPAPSAPIAQFRRRHPQSTPTPSPSPATGSRFAPGTVLGGRYRIVSRLGRGGMGEVYRADDLELAESVALKFLPSSRNRDPGWLSHIRDEVRVTRGITHPNVCRVYDLAESDGETFIAMEFIDGEDLSGLLKRIGRFPRDKAIEIARQLSLGLAAAHDHGVLHRDLKPANIMIDGRGRARITDFGIAAIDSGSGATDGRTAGTPAYMAPEQLDGKPATVRSDIYGLGMVLYELFTGERAVSGTSIAEIRSQQARTTPSSMSEYVADIDPVVERVIRRCLETDPTERPGSALAVAAALPGGDPLGMALAAGETPSPEMVAESGASGALRPRVAVALLLAVFACLGLLSWISGKVELFERITIEPVDVLRKQVGDFLAEIGAPAPRHVAVGFQVDPGNLAKIQEQRSLEALADLDSGPPALWFWWRSSPGAMLPEAWNGRVSYQSPALVIAEMVRVRWGSDGGLMAFERVPRAVRQPGEPEDALSPIDWEPFFSAAGLGGLERHPVSSRSNPPFHCDSVDAWIVEGAPTGSATRVEVGSNQGTPVRFVATPYWDDSWIEEMGGGESPPDATIEEGADSGEVPGESEMAIVFDVLVGAIVLGGIALALRNLRAGRGDRIGARQIGVYLFCVTIGLWFFSADHSLGAGIVWRMSDPIAVALFTAGIGSFFYLAIEPFARRFWPRSIVSFTRMMRGRLRDPLVGRDVLVGVILALLIQLTFVAPSFLAEHVLSIGGVGVPFRVDANALLGTRGVLASIFGAQRDLTAVFGLFVMLLLFRMLTRRTGLAAVLCWVLLSGVGLVGSLMSQSPFHVIEYAAQLLSFVILIGSVARLGLLGSAVMFISVSIGVSLPMTLATDPKYGEASWIGPLIALALALYGFWISLAGQPLFRDEIQAVGRP